MFILQFAILIYSVILHEISHGFVADLLGDPTARLAKRLTLNPLSHIDLIYTILLPLVLLLSGSGVIFGAAKPVPIDPFNFREPKKDTALTALAGPATNILIAAFFSILFRLFPTDLFISVVTLNIILAVFNLIPIPPLDGSKVLAGVLPDNLANKIYRLERYGLFFIFFLLFFFPQVISRIISPVLKVLMAILLP